MIGSAWRWGLVLALAALAGGLGYGGWCLLWAWRSRTALVEIREQVQAGRHGAAARNLAALLAWDPSSDEAAYLLGLCEKARRRTDSADEAWARIPPGSRFAPPAIVGPRLADGRSWATRRSRAAPQAGTSRPSDRWVRPAAVPGAALWE